MRLAKSSPGLSSAPAAAMRAGRRAGAAPGPPRTGAKERGGLRTRQVGSLQSRTTGKLIPFPGTDTSGCPLSHPLALSAATPGTAAARAGLQPLAPHPTPPPFWARRWQRSAPTVDGAALHEGVKVAGAVVPRQRL